jgi:hypothetical protein
MVCKRTSVLQVPTEGLAAYNAGALIQDAFPTLTVDEREMLMTGTHPDCWDSMFPEEED